MLGFALLVYTADGRLVQPFNSWARLYPNGDSWQLLYGMGVLASNFTMFGLNVPSSMDLIVGPSWTLGGELSFYLIAPFILRKSDRFLLMLFLAGLLIRLIPYNAHAPVLSSIEYFVMGALSYRKRDLLLIKVNSARWVDRAIPVAGMLLLMVISLPNLTLLSIPMTHNELTTIVYPPLFALLIPSLYRATEDIAVDRVVGELSYPFYIFHQVVLLVLIGLPWSSKGQFAFVVIIITLLIALLVWQIESRWIEPRRARLSIPVGERRGNARVPPVMGNIPLPVENR
jgi:peptidoglycan/LPS O-acetylase OafA/YrhL